MRSQTWRGLAFATFGVFFAGTNAQEGWPAGLDDLLGQHKNLSEFRSYLQVRHLQIIVVKLGLGAGWTVDKSGELRQKQPWF